SERESLYIVSKFAEDFFVEQLHQSDEGKAIGLSYFRERGFSDEIIQHFKLGYSPDKWNTFTTAALDKGYQKEYLLKAGLTKERDGNLYDGYRGRVIFPIHNLSGRPIGFGGRTLKTDKKVPKYVNSPECDIYNKRKVLYGLYFAKKAIVKADQCLLVEGYTDVISLFQCGLENVVASSGTSLTVDQIRLISRYTKNITILFDGDPAGIKASFRGIDLILEEGLNVKVVLFPEGEDPDSFARKSDQEEMQEFLRQNAKDFLVFKTDLLLQDTEGDPIKKAQLIREIVESIARIPDFIARSVYVKECSNLLDVPEKALVSELNKIRRKNFNKANKEALPEPPPEPEAPAEDPQKWKHGIAVVQQQMDDSHFLMFGRIRM
ncbi:MAG: DNA primase, partial [Bacteroidota bacterium]